MIKFIKYLSITIGGIIFVMISIFILLMCFNYYRRLNYLKQMENIITVTGTIIDSRTKSTLSFVDVRLEFEESPIFVTIGPEGSNSKSNYLGNIFAETDSNGFFYINGESNTKYKEMDKEIGSNYIKHFSYVKISKQCYEPVSLSIGKSDKGNFGTIELNFANKELMCRKIVE